MQILCTVDIGTRELYLEDVTIAAFDHLVDDVLFVIEPIDGFQLETSTIKIAAVGPLGEPHDYEIDPSAVTVDEETGNINFIWSIPVGVTAMPLTTFKISDTKKITFAVCAEIVSGDNLVKAWHSDDGTIKVKAHLEPEADGGEDPSETATNAQKIAQLQTDVAVINTQVGALANGSPTPVATVAEMTDESAVYLYTGSETGYTAGNWYYYDGTAWTSGGTYGGAVTDTTLSISGRPADAKAVGDALDALDDRVTVLESGSSGGLTADIKSALLACFAHVVWKDDDGPGYYDAFESALNPPANLSSITCVYTQSGTVYDTASLDDLKPDLVVTAHWSDNTTSTVTTYTLSGTLTEGTSTITVAYGGETTSFAVTVTLNGWLYRFNQTLASSGSEDFDFTGAENYSIGVDGVGYSYHHVVGTEGTASTDAGAIVSYGLTDVPDFSGDFTVSFWCKTITQSRGSLLSAYNCLTTAQNYYAGTNFGSPQNVKSGWSVAKAQLTKRHKGFRLRYATGGVLGLLISNAGATDGTIYNLTAPSGFDTTLWHHLAVVRNGSSLIVFVNGDKIFDAQVTDSLCFADQVSVGGYWEYTDGTNLANNTFGNYFDDLYVAERCKWTASFDPSAIVY